MSANQEQQELKKLLSPRHIRMIALGGVIGTGIFKGSADTIGLAGPGVIFSYVFAGLLLLIVMAALAEMAIVYPGNNLRDLIQIALGQRFSFVVGWVYCFMWLTVCVIEIIAAGSLLQYWLPNVPLWSLCLLCSLLVIGINLNNVKYFGEIEFWFAGMKIFVIIVFIILGAALLFGIIPNEQSTPALTNYQNFVPNGWGAIFASLLVVIFSYGGSELIGLTITETKDAEKVLPGVVKSMMWRIILFYTLPILIICGLIPWNQIDPNNSPFVQVFSAAGMQGASHFINFVLITAVLSAANSGIYGTTRMMHSLSKSDGGPKKLAQVNKRGVPILSLWVTVLFLLIGTFFAYLYPEQIFSYMLAIPGFAVSLIWISICMAHLKLRPKYPQEPYFKVWLFPYLTLFAGLVLSVSFVMFLFRQENLPSSIISIGFLIAAIIASFLMKKKA
ncbi:amino acid permease [Bacillus pumilus]|uniref:amino acid permease n=1 Tax=Bacillus pumilus TaxID=1408 RepID=UPI0015D55222|nr:amino acid permease [Bacillus pumilus]QLI76336.1 amino acid permease [Bacillus pumilus]